MLEPDVMKALLEYWVTDGQGGRKVTNRSFMMWQHVRLKFEYCHVLFSCLLLPPPPSYNYYMSLVDFVTRTWCLMPLCYWKARCCQCCRCWWEDTLQKTLKFFVFIPQFVICLLSRCSCMKTHSFKYPYTTVQSNSSIIYFQLDTSMYPKWAKINITGCIVSCAI